VNSPPFSFFPHSLFSSLFLLYLLKFFSLFIFIFPPLFFFTFLIQCFFFLFSFLIFSSLYVPFYYLFSPFCFLPLNSLFSFTYLHPTMIISPCVSTYQCPGCSRPGRCTRSPSLQLSPHWYNYHYHPI